MSRLISKMSTMKKETNIKVEFITFYKFCVTGSFYAGIYQALTSCGMVMGDAYNLTLNISTSKGNLETAKANLINVEKQNI